MSTTTPMNPMDTARGTSRNTPRAAMPHAAALAPAQGQAAAPAPAHAAAVPAAPSPIHILQWGMHAGKGGIETFMMELCRRMDPALVRFDFLTAAGAEPMFYEREIEERGGRVFRVLRSEWSHPFAARRELLRFYREHPEIDGVHLHANTPYVFPLKVAREAGIGLRVLHSHNNGRASRGGGLVGRVAHALRDARIARDIAVAPSHYFACSRSAAEFMFPGREHTWVRNGIDTAAYRFDPAVRDAVRARLGLGPRTAAVGFCGWFHEQKNPLFLMESFARFHAMRPDSALLLAGTGPLEGEMRALAREHGMEDAVRFLGPRDDMPRLYQAMDVFVLPSVFEGLGIVCVEAQASGLPCVVSDRVAPEADVTGDVEFLPLEDGAQAWAEAVGRALEDGPAPRERAGAAAEVRSRGYEMDDVAAWMQRFYLEHAVRRGADGGRAGMGRDHAGRDRVTTGGRAGEGRAHEGADQ